MQRIYQHTSIWRPLDPRYPTNLGIVLIAIVIVVARGIGLLSTGIDVATGVWTAGMTGFAVLMSWVVGREIDPDHQTPAFLGAGVTLLALTQLDLPNPTTLFWIVVLMRILNQVVGAQVTWIDSITLLALAAWLSLRDHWLYAALTALAFVSDAWLSASAVQRRRHLFFAVLSLGLTFIAVSIVPDRGAVTPISNVVLSAEIVIALLFVAVIASTRSIRSLSDYGNHPLDPRRVRSAQSIALLSAFVISAWGSVASILPVWSAMLGVVIHRLGIRLARVVRSA